MACDFLQLRALLEEQIQRRQAREALAAEVQAASNESSSSLRRLLDSAYPEQTAAINDPASNVAILGTRRSGKSRGWLRKLCYDAVTIPNSYQVYINTSWHECRRIAWRGARGMDGLLPLNRQFDLGGLPLKSERTMSFPNGSVIECIPADDIPGIERALGVACHRVWIDESQKMPHLDYAVRQILGPTMADFDGQIVLTGTPSIDCSGLFYDVTCDDSKLDGWSVHRLNVTMNPFFGTTPKERFARTVLRHCLRFNLELDDPEVRRQWFGEWVLEDASFVYHVHRVDNESLCYAPARWLDEQRPGPDHLGGVPDIEQALTDLPRRPDGNEREWLFGLGVDTGYEPDPFAMVLWAWTREMPELYEVFSWKQVRLTPDRQNQEIQDIQRRVGPIFVEADAPKGTVKGWSDRWLERYPLPIEEAQKSHKSTAIEFLNNDIRAGTIKLRVGSPLWHEMRALTWTPQKGNARRLENVQRGKDGKKRCPNDCCDAALYAHRQAQHFRHEPEKPRPQRETAEWLQQEEEREYEELLDELQGEANEFWQ